MNIVESEGRAMAKTVSISIEIKIRERDYETKVYFKAYWRKVREAWQTAKVSQVARLHHLLNRFDKPIDNGAKEWPPHSLLCEKRCCIRSFASYHKYLKKELKWDNSGHLI